MSTHSMFLVEKWENYPLRILPLTRALPLNDKPIAALMSVMYIYIYTLSNKTTVRNLILLLIYKNFHPSVTLSMPLIWNKYIYKLWKQFTYSYTKDSPGLLPPVPAEAAPMLGPVMTLALPWLVPPRNSFSTFVFGSKSLSFKIMAKMNKQIPPNAEKNPDMTLQP